MSSEGFEDEGEESVIDEPINLPILTNAVLRERERQRRKDEIQQQQSMSPSNTRKELELKGTLRGA